jgi:myo-inositol-1-phosphate synthase
MPKIRVAIAGVGNCASAFLQGLEHYRRAREEETTGLMHREIGGYRPQDIEVVAAFDIDRRKVGRPLHEAAAAPPNCTRRFSPIAESRVIVQMGPVLDGFAPHMRDYPPERTFLPDDAPACDVARVLREARAEVLLNYMPVGAQRATEHYAQACLAAGVALVNCMPVFIASEPAWATKFRRAGLPVIGDDVKSQVGATILHRALARLFAERGVSLERTYQLNTGGNTDFLNMLDRARLGSKRRSKTEAVASQLPVPIAEDRIHIGPSDYVPWQNDNKVCFIRMEGRGFGGVPLEIELRLSVEDSPNSGGVTIDAVRLARLALDRGLGGPLLEASAYLMKRPPVQLTDAEARRALDAFIAGGEPFLSATSIPRRSRNGAGRAPRFARKAARRAAPPPRAAARRRRR